MTDAPTADDNRPSPKLMRLVDVAAALNISLRTTQRLVAEGQIGSVRVLNRRLCTPEQVAKFIADNTTEAAS